VEEADSGGEGAESNRFMAVLRLVGDKALLGVRRALFWEGAMARDEIWRESLGLCRVCAGREGVKTVLGSGLGGAARSMLCGGLVFLWVFFWW
jgi:hypothetical protein